MLGIHTKKQISTAELDRQVIQSLVPNNIKRRASAQAPAPQTEPIPAVPVWTSKSNRSSYTRLYVLLLIGALCGLVLYILGSIALNWGEDTLAHWHGGDSYVTTLDADVGHGEGISHFLAFYQNGYVVVIEFSPDYKSAETYSVLVGKSGPVHRVVTLGIQTIDGKRDLIISLDNGNTPGPVLYNTGNAFSTTVPQS